MNVLKSALLLITLHISLTAFSQSDSTYCMPFNKAVKVANELVGLREQALVADSAFKTFEHEISQLYRLNAYLDSALVASEHRYESHLEITETWQEMYLLKDFEVKKWQKEARKQKRRFTATSLGAFVLILFLIAGS